MSLSVAIRAYNAGPRFDDVLASLQGLADEIVVVDSGSTDETRNIAKKHGATVIEEPWRGFIAQANFAFEHCTKEWVFLLDQDEVVTDDLKQKILNELKAPRFDGYEINRQTIYLGRRLKHIWYPDWIMRLGKKGSRARCIGDEPHEVMTVNGPIGKIHGHLDHHSYADLNEHFGKLIRYARIGAQSYYDRGKRARADKLLFNPLWGFLKAYLFRLGFLDGIPGLIAAFSTAVHVFLKYAALYELGLKEKK